MDGMFSVSTPSFELATGVAMSAALATHNITGKKEPFP
jgi:hypothetical protein